MKISCFFFFFPLCLTLQLCSCSSNSHHSLGHFLHPKARSDNCPNLLHTKHLHPFGQSHNVVLWAFYFLDCWNWRVILEETPFWFECHSDPEKWVANWKLFLSWKLVLMTSRCLDERDGTMFWDKGKKSDVLRKGSNQGNCLCILICNILWGNIFLCSFVGHPVSVKTGLFHQTSLYNVNRLCLLASSWLMIWHKINPFSDLDNWQGYFFFLK